MHEGTSVQRRQRQRQKLNDNNNLNELTNECHNELTSGEIVSLKILSQIRKVTYNPDIHGSLKLPVDEHVILEEPLSSSGSLSSMKNLDDAYTFGDQFLNDKSTKDELGKLNMDSEVVSMVMVLIHQASSSVSPISTPIIDLSPPRPVPATTHAPIFTATTTPTTTTLPLPPHPLQQSTSDSEHRDDQNAPPPPGSDPSKRRRHDSGGSGSTQPLVPQSSDWKTFNTRETPSSFSKQQSASHFKQPIEDVPITDNVNVLISEDNDTAHLPKLKTRPDWIKPIPEKDRPATPEPESFLLMSCLNLRTIGLTYLPVRIKIQMNTSYYNKLCHRKVTNQVDLVNPKGCRIVPDIRKPLSLEGPPGQVTIQSQYFFNKDLEFLMSGDKGRRSALSISKLKAAHYLDFGLEELVSSLWIESAHEYDISAACGISHWWFKRKEFYITRHDALSNCSKVRSHMRILSVISLKTYVRYGYVFLKEIVLRIADYKEYKISEADFKNLHLNDFEDLYLLHLQGQLNHLSGDDKVHLFNTVNMWIRNIVIKKCV
nr:hypothetical protein [Tanacetum cinerariifolium]